MLAFLPSICLKMTLKTVKIVSSIRINRTNNLKTEIDNIFKMGSNPTILLMPAKNFFSRRCYFFDNLIFRIPSQVFQLTHSFTCFNNFDESTKITGSLIDVASRHRPLQGITINSIKEC